MGDPAEYLDIQDCPDNGEHEADDFCRPIHDMLVCWPATAPNTTAEHPCPFLLPNNDSIVMAYRHCPQNGSWEHVKSNYSLCIDIGLAITTTPGEGIDLQNLRMAEIMRDVYFILSIVSLVLLFVTLFIFQYFRSLHCSRISIHKHLVVSFIFRFIVNIIMVEPYIARRQTSYRDIDWLCKTVTAFSQYTLLANVFWMFVEGFFLHHSLVLGVFSTEPPFKLFYLIGWGLPALFVIAWSIVLVYLHESPCWSDYSQHQHYFIITIPFIAALAINAGFLVNIIRVLVSKLRANNRVESTNIRQAIKATIILMPLLGLTNLLFFMSPADDLKLAYHVSNAVLQSSQGIFVAVLYCFLNGEVRRVIRQKWYRWRVRHVPYTSGRRRSSRTSSFFIPSGTEAEESQNERSNHNPSAEQLRLLQANMALQNEKALHATDTVVTNGTSGESLPCVAKKKNNNNGEVHFKLSYEMERETVL